MTTEWELSPSQESLEAQVVASDLGDLLESPRWNDSRKCISFIDSPTGMLFEFSIESSTLKPYATGVTPLGSALPCVDGSYLLVGADAIWKWMPKGSRSLWAELPAQPGIISNDAIYQDGAVWVGRMDLKEDLFSGSLIRVSEEEVRLVVEGLTIPNGLVHWHQNQRPGFIFAESYNRCLYFIPSQKQSGPIEILEKILELPDWVPDGLALDFHGSLWVARWGEGTVTRMSNSGRMVIDVVVPTPQSTAIAFTPRGEIFITTARENFSSDQVKADSLAGSLFSLQIDT
jgi:sugar lactone lactonase YvrE